MSINRVHQFYPALPSEPATSEGNAGGGGSSASTPASGSSAPPADTPAPAPEFGAEENFQDFLQSVAEHEKQQGAPPAEQPPAPEQQDEAADKTEDSKPATPSLKEQLAEAVRAREAAEARLAALEKPAPQEAPPASAQDNDPEPDPANYEFGLADAKYIADTARWNARQEFVAQEQQRAVKAELAAIETSWNQRITDQRIAEQYPDFVEKVVKGADRDDWALSAVGALLIKNSEFGPDVAYHLASNPEESRRIAAMDPYEQMRAIARLEGRYEALASAPKAPATPPKVAPSAPNPPNRVRGAGGKFAVDGDTEDFAAFSKYADTVLSSR
jgi:hypothetical protein